MLESTARIRSPGDCNLYRSVCFCLSIFYPNYILTVKAAYGGEVSKADEFELRCASANYAMCQGSSRRVLGSCSAIFPLVFLFSCLSSDFLVFSSSLSSSSSSSLLVLPLLLLFVLILILVRRLLLVLFHERNGFLAATSLNFCEEELIGHGSRRHVMITQCDKGRDYARRDKAVPAAVCYRYR